MFPQLSNTEKLAAAVSACILATLTLWICINLTAAPNYDDFIVGSITWGAGTKLQDLIVGPAFILVLFFGFIIYAFLLAEQKRKFGSTRSEKLSFVLICWTLPSLVTIFSLVTYIDIDEKVFGISAFAISYIALITAYHSSKQINVSPEVIGILLLSAFLIALFPFEISLCLGRLPVKLIAGIDLTKLPHYSKYFFGFSVATSLILSICFPRKLYDIFPKCVLIGQLGLPAFFLALYPARFLQPDGILTKYETTIWLTIALFALIAWALYDVFNRNRRSSVITDWQQLFSPVCLFALLIGLKFGSTIPPHISPDDYHFGERLLGFWSYLHGAVPYIDYMPAHGLIDDDLTQLFSYIFYDGSAGSIADAGRLASAFLAFIAFLSIYSLFKNIGLAFISIFFAHNLFLIGAGYKWFFFVPFLCLWFSPSLRKKPAKWLSLWLLVTPILVLGVPPQGLLLAAASGIMVVYYAWQLFLHPAKKPPKNILISISIIFIFGISTPLFSMIYSAIRYVLENGPINQVAYGVPWSLSWNGGIKSGLIFELIRMSWIITPITCLAILYSHKQDAVYPIEKALPTIVVFCFALLLIPYSMGRIDPGTLSRPGAAAIFSSALLLPIIVWPVLKQNHKGIFIVLLAGINGILTLSPFSFDSFISTISPTLAVGQLKYGKDNGLDNIGMAAIEPEHWDRLIRLNNLLNKRLEKEESYLDLTSRNAQYFYLNRKPLLAISAPYNLVPTVQQKREIEHLKANMPRIALLAGDNIIHDGGGLALRNPYLYRFIVDNYTPRLEDGFIIGYRNTENSSSNQLNLAIDTINNETRLSLFDKAFAFVQADLGKIPLAWGQSEKSLQKRMILISEIGNIPATSHDLFFENNNYHVTGTNPQLNFDISNKGLSGHDAGLLKFEFSCPNKKSDFKIQIHWWGDDQQEPSENSSLKFTADNGLLIVPLESSSRWLTLKHLKGIRVSLINPSACTTFNIHSIELFQRQS